jgi:hypothetical protein
MGFNGTGAWLYPCSGNLVAINAADYHQYECNASGTCYHAASDGTDIGPNIPAIDAAQTLNVFNCALVGQTCPGPGPFPDAVPTAYVPAPCISCLLSARKEQQ